MKDTSDSLGVLEIAISIFNRVALRLLRLQPLRYLEHWSESNLRRDEASHGFFFFVCRLSFCFTSTCELMQGCRFVSGTCAERGGTVKSCLLTLYLFFVPLLSSCKSVIKLRHMC